MLKLLAAAVLSVCPGLCWAIAPYVQGESLKPAVPADVAEEVAGKLKAAGFEVLGQYFPKQLPEHGVVVAADPIMLNEIRSLGGANIVGAAIRVGVQSNGTVNYTNPDYWCRAYFRGQFPRAEKSVRALQEKLARTLGAGPGLGGDVPAEELPVYRYALGMERFDSDKGRLAEHVSFDEAVGLIRDNLDKGVARTSQVYEVVMPDEKMALFGVAMHDETRGDAAWVARLGAQAFMAALPYEVYVVDNVAYALYGRYRIALSFPGFKTPQFMRIVSTPAEIRKMLGEVAGAKPKN